MNLKTISIENFKCFGSRVDIDFGRLTLLTGANSSGKTSIIYGILGALQSGEFPFQFSTNGKYVNMGSFKDIVHNHYVNEKIKLDFTFEGSSIKEIKTIWAEDLKNKLPKLFELYTQSDYFSLSIKNQNNKYSLKLKVDPEKSTYASLSENDFSEFMEFAAKKRHGLSAVPEVLNFFENIQTIEKVEIDNLSKIEWEPNNATNYLLKQTLEFVSKLFSTYDEQINFLGPFRLLPEETYYEQSKTKLKVSATGDGYLDQIIYWQTNNDPKIKQLVTNLKKLKLLYSIKTKRVGGGKYEILVKVKKNGIETSLSDVGAGVSQFLPILVADLQLPDGSTLYIAEPESHLHPSAQSSFGDYLTSQIKTTSKNYVIEAHSEYLLNKIRLAIVKGDLKEDDVKVLFLDNDGDNNVIHKIGFKPNGQITNAPKNFFQTYMVDVMDIALNSVI